MKNILINLETHTKKKKESILSMDILIINSLEETTCFLQTSHSIFF